MAAPDFDRLRAHLLAIGTAPSSIERITGELADHYDDLFAERLAEGLDADVAATFAAAGLGDLDEIAAAIGRRPELKSWAWRWPRLAVLVYPLACLAALPAVPVYAGIDNAPTVGRWLAGIVAAALLTATLFLVLQLAITAG